MEARRRSTRFGNEGARRAVAGTAKSLVLLGLATGCSSPSAPPPRALEPAVAAAGQDEKELETFRPRPETTGGDDWIRLVSGEWLRGELTGLDRDRIEFDSEELDELVIEWEDVAEVITEDPFTLLFADRSTLVGVPQVDGDAVRVKVGSGELEFTRREIEGFVRGEPRERNYWSGFVKLGGTVRKGNTDQVDSTLSAATERRTAVSRLKLSLDTVAGSVDGSEKINNQTVRQSLDYYISPRLYARPLGLELFRDRFQNVDLRVTPYASLGYLLLDEGDKEWDVTAGLGYRFTSYDSVEPGEDDSDDVVTGILATSFSNELTDDIDLEFTYGAQIGLEDTNDTNQDASFGLKFEFIWDLDFDFRVIWKRVGQPAADEDGEFPDEDDLRLDVGVSWEF